MTERKEHLELIYLEPDAGRKPSSYLPSSEAALKNESRARD